MDAQTSSAVVSGSNGGASATAKSVDTEEGLKVGEKRKRTTFSAVQQVYLQNALDKGELNTKEGRQLAADVLSKEAGKAFDIASIDNWWRKNREEWKDSIVSVWEFTCLVRMMKYVCEVCKVCSTQDVEIQ